MKYLILCALVFSSISSTAAVRSIQGNAGSEVEQLFELTERIGKAHGMAGTFDRSMVSTSFSFGQVRCGRSDCEVYLNAAWVSLDREDSAFLTAILRNTTLGMRLSDLSCTKYLQTKGRRNQERPLSYSCSFSNRGWQEAGSL